MTHLPGPQKAQMAQRSAPPQVQMGVELDPAIDAVAKQLTRVEDDPHLASRIAMSLPERSAASFGWWALRLAMIAVMIAAGIVWGNRAGSDPRGAEPLAASNVALAPAPLMAAVAELEPNRTQPVEPLEPLEPLEPAAPDHEFGLTPVAPPLELGIAALTPRDLPAERPLTIAPLALSELPLSADFPSQRD